MEILLDGGEYTGKRGNAKSKLIRFTAAGVAELADAQVLGACAERRRGSSPLSCNDAFSICDLRFGLIGIAILSSAVRADSVFVGTLERPDATIQSLDGDSLTFQIND